MILMYRSWSKRIKLNASCIAECQWWFQFLKHGPIVHSLHVQEPTVEIYSDASGVGYGSMWNG